uniref:Uncharacterized protein n=1 Tax=Rhizophora mucronata TaxID=61149 RepID=A0A2P2QI95_RHIMU
MMPIVQALFIGSAVLPFFFYECHVQKRRVSFGVT